jgi:hypothetical protein
MFVFGYQNNGISLLFAHFIVLISDSYLYMDTFL